MLQRLHDFVFNLEVQDTQNKQGKKGRRKGKASNSKPRKCKDTTYSSHAQIVIDIARSDVGGRRRRADGKSPEKRSC
jgi:hypothetical protein